MTSHPPPRVLIVGAGDVGQVYGRHLQLGGAEVTFLVKPHQVEGLEAPLPLYPLNQCTLQDAPTQFSDYTLTTEPPKATTTPAWRIWK